MTASIAGNVTLQAGQAYKQVGSDVIAPAGDITILAKQVDITEARETSRYESEDKFKQSAFTVSVSSPLLSALETGQQMADAASNTSDGRMQVLAGAAAAFKGYNTYKGLTDTAGNFSEKNATDITINLSYGSSESQSNSSSQSNSAAGSTVAAGNNLTIVATGAGQASNLTAQGATLTAGNNVTLLADNKVNLLASQSTASQESSNSSSSSSVGESYGVVSQSFSFSASANQSDGNSNGSDTRYTNTQVTAGNTASIISGGDANLIGAVVAANTVKANVGGNLNIQSLQDTSTYTSEQSSSGASISFGKGSVTGGGISASNSNIDSTYASVVQQSGIKAGDGGFQVNVAGNTDLKGSVIASTQAAVDNNKNTFNTGGSLTLSDIQNAASYEGKAMGLSIDVGQQAGKFGVNGVGAGIGSDKGEASSTSSSGISGIAGNAAVRTGDAETGIAKIFDADRVQREINAQVQIMQAFAKEAPKAVGTYADEKLKEALKSGDQAEIDKWKEGGSTRVALHTLLGALSGGVGGAVGAATSQSIVPMLGQQIALLDIPVELKQTLIALAGTAIGAASGGVTGAVTGLTATANNYLKHTELTQKSAQLTACKTKECRQDVEAQWDEVSQNRNKLIIYSCLNSGADYCKANIEQMSNDMLDLRAAGGDKSKGYTGFTPEERNNIKQVMSLISTNLETLAVLGNLQLGTTYASPDDLVKVGILTEKEGELLKSARADNMVGFLGAIALPAGTKARNPDSNKAANLFEEMRANGIKVSPENVMRAERLPDGRIIFLEKGNDKAGFEHIMKAHRAEFAQMGLSERQVPEFLFNTIQKALW